MTAFRVGQRVRKVRGAFNIGITGTVFSVDFRHRLDPTATLLVRLDCAAAGTLFDYVPGDLAPTHADLWEPILDQHQPCEAEFKEFLDRLVEGVTETVR